MYQILKTYHYSKNYFSNNCKSHIAYVETSLYKKHYNITFNNTNNISKNINQYATDVDDDFKTNKVSNLTKSRIMISLMLLLINIIPYTLMVLSM